MKERAGRGVDPDGQTLPVAVPDWSPLQGRKETAGGEAGGEQRWYRDLIALCAHSVRRGRFFWRGGHMERRRSGRRQADSCETCENYVYDEEFEYYVCTASLDEDDMARFMGSQRFDCPYYRLNDEYRIVRRQM